jgi:GNAT superfamily N-acetyltransferase
MKPGAIEIRPVTADRWDDLEQLFGPRGACAGCWCMWWRLTRAEFARGQGRANRSALRRIVQRGEIPGLMAYVDGVPAGWVSVAPRPVFGALARSRLLAPLDDVPVWSIVCFFIARPYRRSNLTVWLLRAALDFAQACGATVVEGYPVDPRGKTVLATSVYTGTLSAFLQAGFKQAGGRSPSRPIMRCHVRAA